MRQYAVLKGKTFTLKNGVKILQGTIKLNPVNSIIKEAVCMKDLLEISCGLDIHKEKIVACILTVPLGKPTHSEIREFTTLIPDMLALRDWIISENCHHIAMESTGIYWIPIYEILEDAFSGIKLALRSPARSNVEIHSESRISVFLPGTFFIWRALTTNKVISPEKASSNIS